jgi:hypothetical protein
MGHILILDRTCWVVQSLRDVAVFLDKLRQNSSSFLNGDITSVLHELGVHRVVEVNLLATSFEWKTAVNRVVNLLKLP